MGLKELFSKLRKRKSEEEQIPAEASTEAPIEVPTEVKEYKPAPIPADAPACWEKSWGKDMVTISDPEGTCTVRLYGPFAQMGPQSDMSAGIAREDCKTYSAVYTGHGFDGWFVVGSLKMPWDPDKMTFTELIMNPLLFTARLNNIHCLDLPDRMKNAKRFSFGEYLGRIYLGSTAPGGLDGTAATAVSFSIDGEWYIDHIFCANKGEYAWKLECVIPAKDFAPGAEICTLPHYIFSTLCPDVPPKREDLTRTLPDSGGIFDREAIHISKNLEPPPPLEDIGKSLPPYLAYPDDPFSEKYFGSEMLQIRNDPCRYTVQLYGPASGTAPISRWIPHNHFDIRLDLFSSGEGESWYLITTICSKDGTPSKLGRLTSRDWDVGIGHTPPNVELLLPERFREGSFFALSGEGLPLDIRFEQRIQCSRALLSCFAFQMDGNIYKDYSLEVHKGGYMWVLECIIPAQKGSTRPIPTEFVPPGYMFGSFVPLI